MGDATDTPRRPSRRLDRRTVAICVCIALAGAFAAALVTSIALDADDPAPDPAAAETLILDADPEVDVATLLTIALETRDGEPTTLDDLIDDRPVLLNFWQSTCAPCIREMPLLEEAAEANPEVAVLGVAAHDPLEAAERLAAQTGITYPWVLDPSYDLFYEAKGSGMPTTLVLDTDGTILARETGAFDDLAEVQAFLDAGLAER